jgi:hypothetical protein
MMEIERIVDEAVARHIADTNLHFPPNMYLAPADIKVILSQERMIVFSKRPE